MDKLEFRAEKNKRWELCLGSGHVTVARRTADGEPAIDLIETRPCADPSQWQAVLGRLVHQHELAGCKAVAVLEPGTYQLTQIEAPEVPAAEVQAAVRWRLKEFIPYRLEDAVVDAFELPPMPGRSGARLMLAVSAPAYSVQQVVTAVTGAGLALEAIDIPELALRNLASQVPDQAGGVALVALGEEAGLIIISQDELLYLARTLEFGAKALNTDADAYGDSLVLELQRSLDYYESQLAGRPVSRVLLAPFDGGRDVLLERMNAQMSTVSYSLELHQILDCAADLAPAMQAQVLYAVGGTLRPGQVAT